jgi:predicted esterase
VLGELTRKEVLQDMQTRADAMKCYFSQYVFTGTNFPPFQFQQEDALRDYFKPFEVKTTFYNAQYEEVKKADKPGRYGAMVNITMPWGIKRTKFITLYKVPDGGKPGAFITNSKDVHNAENAALRFAALEESPNAPLDEHVRTSALTRNDAWWAGLRKHIGLTVPYAYFVDLPRDMMADPNKKWPLILFLHGWAESGWDINRIRKAGLVKMMGEGKQLPAIVVSPVRPAEPDNRWNQYLLVQLLDEIEAKYNIDLDRVYVTGMSMGGRGAWRMGLFFPDRFAAIVPVSGVGDPTDAAQLINLPIWAFHGDQDRSVPLKDSTDMVDAICKAGGHPHLTVLARANHTDKTWNTVYGMDALYKWLLAQKRGQVEVPVPGVQPP